MGIPRDMPTVLSSPAFRAKVSRSRRCASSHFFSSEAAEPGYIRVHYYVGVGFSGVVPPKLRRRRRPLSLPF